MKVGHILAIVIVAAVVGIGWYIKATFFEAGGWAVTKSTNVEWAIRFETKGGDVRAYGIKHPWGRCVLMAGTRNTGTECIWEEVVEEDVATQ